MLIRSTSLAAAVGTVGGTAEVRHFGMDDDTTDFIRGGSKPARITKPGEFAQLQAGALSFAETRGTNPVG